MTKTKPEAADLIGEEFEWVEVDEETAEPTNGEIGHREPIGPTRALLRGMAIGMAALALGPTIGRSTEGPGQVSPKDEVGAKLEKILKNKAVTIGSKVLAAEIREGYVAVEPNKQGQGEVVHLRSETSTDIFEIYVGMFRTGPGELDPSTTFSVEIVRMPCNQVEWCGGRSNGWEDIQVYDGGDVAPDYTGWHALAYEAPRGSDKVADILSTQMSNPRSSINSADARQAFGRARVWGNYIEVLVDEALGGYIVAPKAK